MALSPDIIARARRMFAAQGKHCAESGVPTYAAILERFSADLEEDAAVAAVLAHWDGVPESAFSLRMLGALHRLALDGRAPALAGVFQTCGGRQNPPRAASAALDILHKNLDDVIAYTRRPPQTNEVGRSSALLGGFLVVAQEYDLPLRLREVGASAGLNLVWDHYAFRLGARSWGNAPLHLTADWSGPPPPLDAAVRIADRAACDRDPIDIRHPEGRARLESYIWPDQIDRMTRLRQACAIAASVPFRLDQADAAAWLEQELTALPEGQATVVFHSVFRQYLDEATDARLAAAITAAGGRATPQAPLAWLALEPVNIKSFPDLTLTLWPGGRRFNLGSAHYHGNWVTWNGV